MKTPGDERGKGDRAQAGRPSDGRVPGWLFDGPGGPLAASGAAKGFAPGTVTLGEIAEAVRGEVRGDPTTVISGVREIEDATPGDLVFAMDLRHALLAARSRAGAVVLRRGLEAGDKPCILVEEPRLALACVLEILGPGPRMPSGVDPTARIAASASISPDVRIGAHVVIEPGATIGPSCVLFPGVYVGFEAEIGEGTVLYPNVVIGERVKVGRRVIIHAGAVIGADGFGFVKDGDVHRKIPQVGTVVIEDDVEIGANACIDRATLGKTVIGQGTKIDNLVQIGHNVRVGRNSIIVGQTGIGGSATLGDGTILAGQVGIVDHVTVGPGATIAAGSLVTTNIRPGEMVSGRPARPHVDELHAEIAWRKLPDLLRSLEELQETVRSLEKMIRDKSGG
ncbi:MAG TPA: UDP-3-O-(3-hydroxymyristoyl)glucosamine N-acyltransferase [Firmicutes bacterium]|nr:UDP-3-O-(3-hydroxymyristoyl)glucosamine N-acyltransferase [Bacillota bacterium]